MAKIQWSVPNDPDKWGPEAIATCSSPELAAEIEKRWNAYEVVEAAAKASVEWEACHPFGHEDAMRELAAILARLKIPLPNP